MFDPLETPNDEVRASSEDGHPGRRSRVVQLLGAASHGCSTGQRALEDRSGNQSTDDESDAKSQWYRQSKGRYVMLSSSTVRHFACREAKRFEAWNGQFQDLGHSDFAFASLDCFCLSTVKTARGVHRP